MSLDFFITVLTAVIDLASFSGILYSIYPNLFYAIFAYATFGSLTTVALGKTRPAPASFFFLLFSRARLLVSPSVSLSLWLSLSLCLSNPLCLSDSL